MKECWVWYHSCLLPVFAMLQQAVRPSGPSCQCSFKSSLFLLSANSHLTATNVPSLLLHPVSHSSVPWIKWVTPSAWQIRVYRQCNYSFGQHHTAELRQWQKKWQVSCCVITSFSNECSLFFAPELFTSHLAVCWLITNCKTNILRCF